MSPADTDPFHPGERSAQARWGDPSLWTPERIERLIWTRIPEPIHARLEAAPFFFLATSDDKGRCDCAFKGGGPGLVRVLSATRLAFPHFAARVKGNGTYTSLGNLLVNPWASLLFIDFTDGARLRINGRATLHDRNPLPVDFPQAECVIVVEVEKVMPSCSSHVPRLVPLESSP